MFVRKISQRSASERSSRSEARQQAALGEPVGDVDDDRSRLREHELAVLERGNPSGRVEREVGGGGPTVVVAHDAHELVVGSGLGERGVRRHRRGAWNVVKARGAGHEPNLPAGARPSRARALRLLGADRAHHHVEQGRSGRSCRRLRPPWGHAPQPGRSRRCAPASGPGGWCRSSQTSGAPSAVCSSRISQGARSLAVCSLPVEDLARMGVDRR